MAVRTETSCSGEIPPKAIKIFFVVIVVVEIQFFEQWKIQLLKLV